jgi:dTDP-4-dehydrorhamnose reductase
MRLAVTGATGRLGGAVVASGRRQGVKVLPWTRVDFDLDEPQTAELAVEHDRPDVVIHCAAWTDVDGCARDPALADRRNGEATATLARAAAARGIALVAVSTNEVFDGGRTDGTPYEPWDQTSPGNPYGASKLRGEIGAREAYGTDGGPALWIVRTAWLFGPPGNDFPMKILAAARSASAEGRTLSLVADEVGCPTAAADLAEAILDIVLHRAAPGVHHVVNAGSASRAEWARRVLSIAGIDVTTKDVPLETWLRPSTPPKWGVLAPTTLPTLGRLRSWQAALEADLSTRLHAGASAGG